MKTGYSRTPRLPALGTRWRVFGWERYGVAEVRELSKKTATDSWHVSVLFKADQGAWVREFTLGFWDEHAELLDV